MGKQDYIVKADSWTAGKWRAKGSIVSLTAVAAKYENVTLKKDRDGPAYRSGSDDDQNIKPAGSVDQVKVETAKQSRVKK